MIKAISTVYNVAEINELFVLFSCHVAAGYDPDIVVKCAYFYGFHFVHSC